jgi:hypothetical protein
MMWGQARASREVMGHWQPHDLSGVRACLTSAPDRPRRLSSQLRTLPRPWMPPTPTVGLSPNGTTRPCAPLVAVSWPAVVPASTEATRAVASMWMACIADSRSARRPRWLHSRPGCAPRCGPRPQDRRWWRSPAPGRRRQQRSAGRSPPGDDRGGCCSPAARHRSRGRGGGAVPPEADQPTSSRRRPYPRHHLPGHWPRWSRPKPGCRITPG